MPQTQRWIGYAWAAIAVTACTVAGFAMTPRFDLVNVAMVYLLAVVGIALRFSRGPAIAASALSVTAFDVLFVPPRGALTVDDAQYLLTFAIMLAVGLLISRLVDDIRRSARVQAKLEVEAETARIRSTLLASISHDLRTPLAVITGASSNLAERGDLLAPDERTTLARTVFDQARDLTEQVTKVLEMTRLETGAIEVDRDWSAPSEIVSAALGRTASRMAQHRLVVEAADDLPVVRVDAALVAQALANLLENAARHTPAGTVVRLRVRLAAPELIFSVEDFGGGVDDRDLERVFEKFHRGTTEGSATGIGLGLAIARAIVKLHRGRAWAERVAAGGMAFRFAIPIEAAPEVPRETQALD